MACMTRLLGRVCGAVLLLFRGMPVLAHAQDASPNIVIENDLLRFEIGPDGLTKHVVAKADGKDWLDTRAPAPVARMKKQGRVYDATQVARAENRLNIAFGDSGVTAELDLKVRPTCLEWEVASVTGDGVEEMTLLDVPFTAKGAPDDPFALCAIALNLRTNVVEIPGPMKCWRALCYPRFGMQGAAVALIGCPNAQLRTIEKEVLANAPELPKSNVGGPYALDTEGNFGSYLFDFGQLTEETVDAWIKTVKTLGLNQIDFHTGSSLRFGDCRPNPKLFPNGRASVKAVLDKLHEAGIMAGLHTYAFFIAKDTPYVTPVPDPRLGKDATFTLAEAMDAESKEVAVRESTKDISLDTAFFRRNSVTVQVENELITYTGVDKEGRYAFTGCARGACGTQVAAHPAGVAVHHLKECFGLFTPDADSSLLAEVATNAADTFNECGFDMMYLDALDGEDILAGAENSWHYGSQFVYEIANRLNKPALFEMSTFHHHLWCVRARMGAWDHPGRAHKRFVDAHCAANYEGRGAYLPMNLGWWAVQTSADGPGSLWQEPTYSDDIEYLMGKCLAYDMSLSLMGVNPSTLNAVPAYQRLAPIFQNYERLRHAHYFTEAVKQPLRTLGEDFSLESDGNGGWRFRPAHYDRHKVCGIDGWSDAWTVENRYAPQPIALRIEALSGAASYGDPEGAVFEDFQQPDAFSVRESVQDVSASLSPAAEPGPDGAPAISFGANSKRQEPNGAWAKMERPFTPAKSIAGKEALGVWVRGDGRGELLNIQMRSSEAAATGGLGDHYINVDFNGWRYFDLLEIESARIAEHAWPYSGSYYAMYRESVDYGKLERLSLWYNQLPTNSDVRCDLGPLRALPLRPTKLLHPQIAVAGRTLSFPVEMATGSYLEFRGMDDCVLYGPKGEELAKVTPEGDAPVFGTGGNVMSLACGSPEGLSARAWVTTIVKGEPLGK